MELSSHEGEIPIPINSVYGHMSHHHHHHNNNNNNNNNIIIPSTNSGTQQVITIPSPPHPPPPPTNTNGLDHHDHHTVLNNNNIVRASPSYDKSATKYGECLKNHAAAMGGNATDGCGEFMPSGEVGSLEALTCSACNCHRNFHRKEVEGKLFLGHHSKALMYSSSSRTVPNPPHQQMIMPYTAIGPPHLHSDSDEHDHHHHHHHHQVVKKRIRTKFTQEQKEKMMRFAERVGWKIQKQEEGEVQQLCQEIGIKRRVLKVWMHNNKAKKTIFNPSSTNTA